MYRCDIESRRGREGSTIRSGAAAEGCGGEQQPLFGDAKTVLIPRFLAAARQAFRSAGKLRSLSRRTIWSRPTLRNPRARFAAVS